jgi:hypothetical protein
LIEAGRGVTPVIPALRRLRLQNWESKASLGYIARSFLKYFKKETKRTKKRRKIKPLTEKGFHHRLIKCQGQVRTFFFFFYSHVHTLFGSFLPPAPLPHPLPPSKDFQRKIYLKIRGWGWRCA